jgi:hypothetical protein
MDWIEILAIIFAVGLVAFTVIYNIMKRKKGKRSDCCDYKPGEEPPCDRCAGCPYERDCNNKKS